MSRYNYDKLLPGADNVCRSGEVGARAVGDEGGSAHQISRDQRIFACQQRTEATTQSNHSSGYSRIYLPHNLCYLVWDLQVCLHFIS